MNTKTRFRNSLGLVDLQILAGFFLRTEAARVPVVTNRVAARSHQRHDRR